MAEAADFYGLTPETFFSSRRGYSTRAREAVAHVLIHTMGWGPRRVAKFFRKDPGSVYDGEARCTERLKQDPIFFELVDRLKRLVVPV